MTNTDIYAQYFENDYLGRAAEAKHRAKKAEKANLLDQAWGYYHQQKTFYGLHANRSGFTVVQTLLLDSTVSEGLANVLRLEGKHAQALVHILYWIIAHKGRPIKRHDQKLPAYWKRCKFKNISIDDVRKYIANADDPADFVAIQSQVSNWNEAKESAAC